VQKGNYEKKFLGDWWGRPPRPHLNTPMSNTAHMTIFLSGRQRTGALCVQHSPTAAALSTNTAFE